MTIDHVSSKDQDVKTTNHDILVFKGIIINFNNITIVELAN